MTASQESTPTPEPDIRVETSSAPIVWPAGEQRRLLGMLVTPDDDDDQDVPAPNFTMDFTATILTEGPIAAPG